MRLLVGVRPDVGPGRGALPPRCLEREVGPEVGDISVTSRGRHPFRPVLTLVVAAPGNTGHFAVRVDKVPLFVQCSEQPDVVGPTCGVRATMELLIDEAEERLGDGKVRGGTVAAWRWGCFCLPILRVRPGCGRITQRRWG